MKLLQNLITIWYKIIVIKGLENIIANITQFKTDLLDLNIILKKGICYKILIKLALFC